MLLTSWLAGLLSRVSQQNAQSVRLKRRVTNGRMLSVEVLEDRALLAAFTPGDVVIYRAGDGSGPLINTGNVVFLDEYTPSGTLVQSIALPSTGTNKLISSGTATSEGLLNLAADGQSLVLTGYNAALGGSSLSATSSATVARTIGLVDVTGAIDVSTLTNASTGNNPRSAIRDGNNLWIVGGAGGLQYVQVGGTTVTAVNTTGTALANMREVNIFNGQLYVSDSSGSTFRLASTSPAEPTATGASLTNLPGFSASTGSPYQFFFARLGTGTAFNGYDTLYVADDSPGTIQKFSYNGSTWAASGSLTASLARGLTGVVNGTSVTLYGTTGASAATGGGSLYVVTDTSGFNATITGTVAVNATLSASSNEAFRGVALSPDNGIVAITGVASTASSYAAGTTAIQVAVSAAFSDVSNFKGGSLTLSYGSGGGASNATDLLSIMNGNNIAYNSTTGVVTYDYGGTTGIQTIGLVTLGGADGTGGKSLSINFNPVNSTTTSDVLATNAAAGVSVNVTTSGSIATTTTATGAGRANAIQALLRQIFFSTSGSAVAHSPVVSFKVTQNGGLNTAGQTGAADTITIPVVAGAPNNAPAGTDATFSMTQDTDYVFGAADFGFTDPNDSPANSLLAVTITTLPGAGTLIDKNVPVSTGQSIPVADITGGHLKFTPAAGATGSPYTTFTFQVEDNGGTANGGADLDASPNTLTFNVNASAVVNHAPAGADTTVATNEDTAYVFAIADFGFTDTADAPANALKAVKITTLPGTGTLTDNGTAVSTGQFIDVTDITAGLLKFTPALNANGTANASFTFQVQDNGGTANSGIDLDQSANTLTVNVASVNDGPIGTSNSVTTSEETAYVFVVADFGFTDPNDSPTNSLAAVKITALPGAGSLSDNGTAVTVGQVVALADITSGQLKFTPAVNASATPYTTFTFQVQDNGGTTNSGIDLDPSPKTMTVNVTAVNDAPAGTDKTVSDHKNTDYVFAAADFGFSDPNDAPENNLLGVTITTLPGAGALKGNGAAITAGQTISLADVTAGLLKFTPATDALAVPYTTFTFQVQDDGGTLNGGVDLDQTPNTLTINVVDPTTLGLGDIAFTGYQGSGTDKISFVLLKDVTIGTVLTITDDSWTGSALTTNEGTSTITFAAAFPAGTQFNFDASRTAGSRWAVGSTATNLPEVTTSNFALNASGDNLFAYNGTTVPATNADAGWISAFAANPFLTTGSATTALTFLPSIFTPGDTAFSLGLANAAANENSAETNLPATVTDTATGIRAKLYDVTQWTNFTAAGAQAIPPATVFVVGSTGGNHAPAGTDKTITTNEDVAYAFTAADFGFTDPNDSTPNALLAVEITTLPSAGMLSMSGGPALKAGDFVTKADIDAGKLIFTPAANANGSGYASFTFQVQDDGGTSGVGIDLDPTPKLLTINVTAVNDAPVTNDGSLATAEDTANTGTLVATDIDNTANQVTISVVAGPAHGMLQINDVHAGTYTYTPDANYNGPDSFTFKANDGSVDSNLATVSINVTPVNDAPTIAPQTLAVAENSANGTAVGLVVANDVDLGDTQSFAITGGNALGAFAISTDGHITVLDSTQLDFETNPTFALTVTVTDAGGLSASNTVTVNLTDLNEAPVLVTNRTITINPTQSVQIGSALLQFADPETGLLTYTITSGPTAGNLKKNGNAITTFTSTDLNASDTAAAAIRYTTTGSAGTSDSFTVSVSDGTNTITGITVNINIVAPVTTVLFTGTNYTQNFDNLLPTPIPADKLTLPSAMVLPAGWSVAEYGGTFGTVGGNADSSIQIDNGGSGTGDVLLYGATGSNSRGLGSYSSGSLQSVYGVALVNNTGTTIDNFSLAYLGEQWKDGGSGSAVFNKLTFDYSTTATSISNGTYTRVSGLDFTAVVNNTTADKTLDGSLAANQAAVSGTVNSGFSWAPNATLWLRWTDLNETGNDDGLAIDNINFSAVVNNAPVGSNGTLSTAEDTPNTGTLNVTDPDNTPPQLTISVVTGPAHGSVHIDDVHTGAYTYTPAANYNGPDSFTFKANYGKVDSSAATIMVTVTAVNDAPAGTSKTVTTSEDTAYPFTAADFGFTDPNDSTPNALLAVEITTLPSAGILSVTGGPALKAGDFVTKADIDAGKLIFTPAANANGSGYSSFTFQVQDDGGTTGGGIDLDPTPKLLTIDVAAVNDAPVALNGSLTTAEDTANSGTLVATDIDNTVDQVTISVVTDPAHGMLQINDLHAGTYTYTPDANYNGPDSFTFKANDGSADSNIATVLINVTAVNDAPTIAPQTLAVAENSANGTAVGLVVANDVDLGDTQSFAITGGNALGAFAISTDGHVTVADSTKLDFESNPTFALTVTVTDAGGLSASNTVTVNLTDVNEAPVLVTNRTITINPTQSVQIGSALLQFTDPENGLLTYTITSGPTAGNLKKNGNVITTFTSTDLNAGDTAAAAIRYTTTGAAGTSDSFTVSVSDGTNTITGITININIVNPVTTVSYTGTTYTQNFDNLIPTPVPADKLTLPSAMVLPAGWSVAEFGGTFGTVGGNADSSIQIDNGGSGTGDILLYGATGSNSRSLGSYSSGSLQSVYGVALVNNTGSAIDNFSLAYLGEQWKDGGSGSAVFNKLTFDYSTTATSISNGTYTRVSGLDFTAVVNNTTADKTLDGSLAANQAAVSGTVNSGFSWAPGATLWLRWSDVNDTGNDDGLAIDNLSFSSVVTNHPPAAASDTLTTAEDTPNSGILAVTDPENSPAQLTISVVAGPSHGSVHIDDIHTGAYTYTPDANYNGPDSFTFKANDGLVDSNTATIGITVTAVNDAPVTANGSLTTTEDFANTGILSATDVDNTAAQVTISVVTGPAHGSIQIDDVHTGAYTYTPNSNYNGPDSFTFKANDGVADSNTSTVSITVTSVNDAPVASNGNLTTAEDTPNSGILAVTDVDNTPAQLTISVVSGPSHGAIHIDDVHTGAYTYTPDANYNGPDSFTFKANDGSTDGNTATVAITVTAVNDAPGIAPQTFSLPENTANAVIVGKAVATDVESDPITFTLTGGNTLGAFAISNDGTITVADASQLDFETNPTFSLNVTVTDPSGAFTSNTIIINLTNVNEAPTALALSSNQIAENHPAGTTVGTLSSIDPDAGDTFTYTLVSGSGSSGNAAFEIIGNVLQTTAAFDFETQSSYSVRIQTQDVGGLTVQQVFQITVTNVNEAPRNLASSATTVAENQPIGTAIGTLTTTDSDAGDTFTYSLVTGAGSTDNAAFQIVNWTLETNASVDFEIQPTYSIRIRTTDSGGLTFEKSFTITATNVNEAPSDLLLSGSSVPENQPVGTAIGTFTTTDPDAGDTFADSLGTGTGSDDNALFQIVGSTLQTKAVLNFEAQSSYSIRVRTTDVGGLTLEKIFTITATDVNEAPTSLNLSSNTIAENQPTGTPIGTFTTTDPDAGDEFAYSLVSGTGSADNASFQIVGGELQSSTSLDFEAQSIYSIRVRVTDIGGLTLDKVFSISATDVNDAPSSIALSANVVAENQPVGTAIGMLTTTDQDSGDQFTYSLVSGSGSTDNALFRLVGNGLQTNASLDFEAQPTYSIRIRSTDAGGLSVEKVFTVTATNVNDAPTNINLVESNPSENQPVGTVIGSFSTVDQDAGDSFTYALVGGTGSTDNGSFRIVNGTLQTNAVLNFEAQSTYSIRVRTTDAGGLTFEKTFVINATNVNEAPSDLALSGKTVAENQPVGTSVGTFATTDFDVGDTFTYALATGTGSTDNSAFQIIGNSLLTNSSFDFETRSSYSIRVRTTDAGGLSFEKVFTITVTDVDDAPSNLAISASTIPENRPIGTTVGTLSTTDADAVDSFTYSLVTGLGSTDNARFRISGNSLQTNSVLDFEAQTTYSIRVRTTDAGGLTFEKILMITVTNVNEAPTDVALSANTVAENQPAGTVIGTLTTTDPDAGDTFAYTLVSGTGGNNNAMFQVSGNTLVTAGSLDFEAQPTYSIRVRTTDAAGLTFEKVLTIVATNVNEAPTNLGLSASLIAENQPIGTLVGSFTTTDPDAGDTFTDTLVDGVGSADNALFQIVGGVLQTNAVLDFEAQASYSIRVRTVDAGGLAFEKVFAITGMNVNEAPTDLALSNATIPELQPVGTTIGSFTTIDPDSGDVFSYSLAPGAGATDNARFQINGNTLKTNSMLDFQTQPTYNIRVRTTDAGGLTVEKVFTISLTAVNQAPTDLALSSSTISENQPTGTSIGAFSTTDREGGAFTYALVPGAGSTDNNSFQIVGGQLQSAASFNFEGQQIYNIRVRTTDAGGLTFEKTLAISVTNVDEVPTALTLSAATVAENQPIGTVIGTFTTTDPDQGESFTYSLISGSGSADNASFQIVGNVLQTSQSLNFEGQATYSIRVRTTDAGGLTLDKTFNITATNVNEASTDIALSNSTIAGTQTVGTPVGTLTTADPDAGESFTYSLVPGTGSTDNGLFQIVSGVLQTNANLSVNTATNYSVRIRSTDAGGLSVEKSFSITVTSMNQAPTDIQLAGQTLPENQPIGTAVGTFSTIDPNAGDTFSYSLVTGAGSTDNAHFRIIGNSLQSNSVFSFAELSSYSIRVRSTDAGGLSTEKTFTITVTSTNVNHPPADLNLSQSSVSENLPVGTVIGSLTTTDIDAGDTFTYTLVGGTGGTDDALFQIVGGTLQTNARFDFETKSSYSIRIRTTDAGGLTADKVFTITILDANDPPVVTLTSGSTTTPTSQHVIVDSGATVSDQDSTNLKDNRLVVTIQSGAQAPDQLKVTANGKQSDKLKVAGGHLKLGKTILGTVTGGKKGQSLTITFTADITTEVAQRVVRSISFQTHRAATGTRQIEFQMFDATNASGTPFTKAVVVGNLM